MYPEVTIASEPQQGAKGENDGKNQLKTPAPPTGAAGTNQGSESTGTDVKPNSKSQPQEASGQESTKRNQDDAQRPEAEERQTVAPAPRSPLTLAAEPSALRTDDPPVTLQTQRQTQQDGSEAPQVDQDQQTRHRRQGQGSQRTSFCTKMQKHYKRKRGNARPQPHCSEPTPAVATPRTKCMTVEWRESMDDFDTERTHLVAQLCKDHPADCAFPIQDQDGGGGAAEKGKPWRYVQDLRDLALHGRQDEPQEEDSEPTLPFRDPTEGDEPDQADNGNEWGRFKEQDRIEQRAE